MKFSSLLELQTPHAVVDTARMERNIARVSGYARDHRLGLRPHIKTHKDPEIAELQLRAGALGVTVATAREAEVMSSVAQDILVAFPPVDPGRITRLANLPPHVNVEVALDSAAAVERLSMGLAGTGRSIGVLVEVDLGARRTGVSTTKDAVRVALAATRSKGTTFVGLMVHPGHVHGPTVDPAERVGHDGEPSQAVIDAVLKMDAELRPYIEALAAEGLGCSVVSGGNTPSLFASHYAKSLTEVRPGTYVYCDRDTAAQGVFRWEDCAYSVLATVVSTAVPGQAVVDAGTKAIAREPLLGLSGFGALLDRPEVTLKGLNEEHGILDLSRTSWVPVVGDRVRIVPNHVCVSVHLQDRVAFLSTGELSVRSVAARGR